MHFTIKVVMKRSILGTIVVMFITCIGLLLPIADGLFFNPEGGFSIGGVHVSIDQNQATISPGETAVFNITVANDSEFPVLINATAISLSTWKTSLEPGFLLLQPHSIQHLILCVTAPTNADNGTLMEMTILYAVSFPETGESMSVPATTIQAIVKDDQENSNFLALAIAASAGICLAVLFSTDKGKLLASSALAPLYSRIHKNNVLNNEIRNGIFNFIRDHPGENFSEIKRQLTLNNGVLSHHLRTLEREHYIKSKKDGLYRRFFLRHQPVPNIILNASQKQILNYLVHHPGSSQSEIALNLGISRQTVNYHALPMEKMGAIRIARHGRHSLCYPLIRASPGNSSESGFAK